VMDGEENPLTQIYSAKLQEVQGGNAAIDRANALRGK